MGYPAERQKTKGGHQYTRSRCPSTWMNVFAPTGKRVRRIIERGTAAPAGRSTNGPRIASRAPCSGNVNAGRAGRKRDSTLPWRPARLFSCPPDLGYLPYIWSFYVERCFDGGWPQFPLGGTRGRGWSASKIATIAGVVATRAVAVSLYMRIAWTFQSDPSSGKGTPALY